MTIMSISIQFNSWHSLIYASARRLVCEFDSARQIIPFQDLELNHICFEITDKLWRWPPQHNLPIKWESLRRRSINTEYKKIILEWNKYVEDEIDASQMSSQNKVLLKSLRPLKMHKIWRNSALIIFRWAGGQFQFQLQFIWSFDNFKLVRIVRQVNK